MGIMMNLKIVLVLMCVLVSCKKDDASDCSDVQQETNVDLGGDTSKIAYTGYETIKFKQIDTFGNILDTIILIGQGRQYSRKYIGETGAPNKSFCTTALMAESYLTKYNEQNSDTTFFILETIANQNGADLSFSFPNIKYELGTFLISNPQALTYRQQWNLDGNIYYHVTPFYYEFDNKIDSLYLNSSNGLIRLVEENYILNLIP